MPGSIPVPGNISECSTGADILIVRQGDRNPIVLGFSTLCWLGFVIFTFVWFHEMLGGESFLDRIQMTGWLAMIFLASPAVIAVVSGYALLTTFFNHTDILVTGSHLEIRIRPIPCGGKKTLLRSAIIQLFVREKLNKDSYGKITKSYQLQWIDSRNQKRPLIRGLRVHEALYLENRLEEILGIEDQPVSGAYAGYKFYE